jgi:phenylacetate-CoA ligase
MEEVQWWPAQRIAAFQLQRLRDLLQDVAVNVPYYRDLFAQLAFDPASVQSTADLQHLPFLNKTIIRANTDALKHRMRWAGRLIPAAHRRAAYFIGTKRVSHDVICATASGVVLSGNRGLVAIELGKIASGRARQTLRAALPAFEMSEAADHRGLARSGRMRLAPSATLPNMPKTRRGRDLGIKVFS